MHFRILTTIAAASAAILAPAAQAQARTPAAAQRGDPYSLILANLQKPEMAKAAVDGVVNAIVAQVLGDDPEMQELVADEPDFVPDFKAALHPIFSRLVKENMALSAQRTGALLRQRLTSEEAQEAADFFGDPAMQSLLTRTHELNRHTQVMAPENLDGDITEAQLTADRREAVGRAAREISAIEAVQLQKRAEGPGVRKFMSLKPELMAINLEIENRPLTPELEAEMMDAMAEVFEKYGLLG